METREAREEAGAEQEAGAEAKVAEVETILAQSLTRRRRGDSGSHGFTVRLACRENRPVCNFRDTGN